MKHVLTSIVLPVLAIYLVLVIAVWLGQRRLIYLPFGSPPSPASMGLRSAEEVAFPTDDGLTLRGWFVPPAEIAVGAESVVPTVTVIVFNGNGGHRGLRAPLAAALARRGIATLLFDYRGYGGNLGSPSEEGLANDARAALTYVLGRSDVDADRIVYFGESLGTGVAVRLATEQPPRALILRSPFTSLADIGAHHYPIFPVRWLARDRFPSIDRIAHVTSPLLVIGGDRDAIVPFRFSLQLFQAAPEPKELVRIDDADHNDMELLAGPRVVDAVDRFIRAAIR